MTSAAVVDDRLRSVSRRLPSDRDDVFAHAERARLRSEVDFPLGQQGSLLVAQGREERGNDLAREFLIIAERRKRGDRYWVARAYHHGRRSSVYLGRAFGEADVRRAAAELAAKLEDYQSIGAPTDPATVDAVMLTDDGSPRGAEPAIERLSRRAQVRKLLERLTSVRASRMP
jgi:hypothetical protein